MAGVALLALGGEAVVQSALAIARRVGVSPLLAGLVIVGFGTSAPELVVTVDAVLRNRPEIALGNIIGSNIANVLLILGGCGLLAPLAVRQQALRRDGVAMLAATIAFIALMSSGVITRLDATLLLCALLGYLIWAYRTEKHRRPVASPAAGSGAPARFPRGTLALWAALIGGLSLLILGSRLLLTGAVNIAESAGVSDAAIGLTLVAAGTSLPELAVCVVATLRRQADVVLGNVLGSNLFNLLAIAGVSAMVQPLPVPGRILTIDQWVMTGSAMLVLVFLLTGRRLSRLEGALLLACYSAYVVVSFTLP